MTKKVILFLVEGPTDEDALAVIFTKLVNNHDIEFDVLHTDITADEDMTVKYIEAKRKNYYGASVLRSCNSTHDRKYH